MSASAKFINSLSDEHNKDLQKQIGCMNGIFQIFDRHHFLSSRRIVAHNQNSLPSSGRNRSQRTEQSDNKSQKSNEKKNPKPVINEKHRNSTESSRSSFSSSSRSSSFSSADCSRLSHLDSAKSSFSHINIPDIPSCQPSQSSFDLRDVVKDFIQRDARTISIKHGKGEESGRQTLKYMDSPRPAHQFREGPRNSNERRDDQSPALARKDAPRFSYDGRESKDKLKAAAKLRELPRLSLDSRERSMRNQSILDQEREHASHKRSSSVVAKLMGLEALPDFEPIITSHEQLECDSFPNKLNGISAYPRNTHQEPSSPQLIILDSVKKSTKFPIEPAPWRQANGSNSPRKPTLKCQGSNFPLSVYGEIEKRLGDLEFKKSGKDLRALKQILASMQKTKQLLETRKEEQRLNVLSHLSNDERSLNQSSKPAYSKNVQISQATKAAGSPKGLRSPIVIIKPTKHLENRSAGINLTISIERKPGMQRLQCSSQSDNREEVVKQSVNRNIGARTSQTSPRLITGQQMNSGRTSGTLSPRMQQRKLEFENRSRPTTPSSEANMMSKPPNSRQPINLGSPRRSPRPKPQSLHPSDDELSGISTISIKSENSSSRLASHVDSEAMSSYKSERKDSRLIQHGDKHQNQAARFINEKSLAAHARGVVEQPSPISVLDASFDGDESPSPLKKVSNAFKGEVLVNDEAEWTHQDMNYSPICSEIHLGSATDHSSEQSTQDFLQLLDAYKVTTFNSTTPHHKYILEILIVSGLIRDLESNDFTIKAHSSGCLINPKLFLTLEQKNASANGLQDGSRKTIQRAHLFDMVNEILYWKLVLEDPAAQWLFSCTLAGKRPKGKELLEDLCSEIDKLQANCSVYDEDEILESMLDRSVDWTGWQNETSGLVLDIERLIFKDLISEVLAGVAVKPQGQINRAHCRQLFSK
ncbi:hypothetical protein ACFE04_006298 [Oxalis oulophora]